MMTIFGYNGLKKKSLWIRWVIANALGELFGLGLTFGVAVLLFTQLGEGGGVWIILLTFIAAVGSGAIEATIVGLAQWWAMHPWFRGISRFRWWLATLIGALIAYVLGYLPSTLINLGEQVTDAAPMADPPQYVILLLAAGMGLVGGAVLSFAQWLVLRRHVNGAGIWVPANMLAWMLGMPVIFWGIDIAQMGQSLWQAILTISITLVVTGAIVGAVHGAFLVKLAGRYQPDRNKPGYTLQEELP
jgi:hypothetical protein